MRNRAEQAKIDKAEQGSFPDLFDAAVLEGYLEQLRIVVLGVEALVTTIRRREIARMGTLGHPCLR